MPTEKRKGVKQALIDAGFPRQQVLLHLPHKRGRGQPLLWQR